MTTAATTLMPLSVLDDDACDDLPSFIEERRAIPIIGPELLVVTTETWLRLLCAAKQDLLHKTRLWRDRITQAQRGIFPWTGRGKS